MQEITRIHLAGSPFNIELAAKKELEQYLEAVRHSLHADADAMREIESRMSELLAARGVKPEGVIAKADVNALCEQLGSPDAFAETTEDTSEQPATDSAKERPTRRLMRDPEHAMLGGVCSGLAAYFGIDTVWVRLAFGVLVFVTSGVFVPLYILLWVIMPAAKTASDRLEMNGEPVTLGSLKARAKAVQHEAKEPILVQAVRIICGAAFVTGAIGAMVATVSVIGVVIAHHTDIFVADNTSWLPLSLGLMAAAGTLLSILFGLTAYVCFKKAASRTVIIALIVTAILGISTFTSGAVMMATKAPAYRDKLTRTESTTTLDTAQSFTADVTALNVRFSSEYPATIVYEVSTAQRTAKLKYNEKLFAEPAVSFKREGTTLVITGATSGAGCQKSFFIPCSGTATLYLYGPSLTDINSNAALSYKTSAQDNLQVIVTNSGNLSLASSGMIAHVRATVQNASSLDTSDATIGDADLTVSGVSSAIFDRVSTLAVTASEVCHTTDQGHTTITVGTANTVSLNGKPWSDSSDTGCVDITR